MLALKPDLIEIVSWIGMLLMPTFPAGTNKEEDFGESHYICPAEPNHSDDGSSQWANGMPHDGWRIIMKPCMYSRDKLFS
jgi:glucan endo-1,3-alpha-glucosidase